MQRCKNAENITMLIKKRINVFGISCSLAHVTEKQYINV